MKRIILVLALLLPVQSYGGAKSLDVRQEISDYLNYTKVRNDCTVQMYSNGVPLKYGAIYCDCMVSIINKNYGKSYVRDAAKIPVKELKLIQKYCGELVADIVRKENKIGEQSSGDKVK